jgi:hypothetical protein
MNLAFIRDRRAAEQLLVAIEQRHLEAAIGQRQCDATSLKASA